jgi:serine/threonine protein kinase
VRLTEAITSEFIRNNTTIPVPSVLDVFRYKGNVHIVSEYINAPVLEDVWHRLTPEDKKECMQQLKGYIGQLRSLVPPQPGRVEAVDGSCLTDARLDPEASEWGPFDSHEEFNGFLGYKAVLEQPERYSGLQAPLKAIKGRTWRTVFTHGDLGPHNILWDLKLCKIVAIIDWEMSGWFPEYWEYTRAFNGPGGRPGWWEMFQQYVDCYPEELLVEDLLASYLTRL